MIPQAVAQLARILGTRAGAAGATRLPIFYTAFTTTIGIVTLPITYPLITGGQYIREQMEDKEALQKQREIDEIPLSQRKIFKDL